MINRFRREVYQSFERRGDAGLDLIDAMSSAATVESPVALSESPLFQREFSSVYDVLNCGRLALYRVRDRLKGESPSRAMK